MINEKYIIKKKLGEGRSRVFLCEDIDFPGKDLAIKVLPVEVSSEEAETFRNEYFILRRLNHPNIIKAIDIGTVLLNSSSEFNISQGSRFITLEYFEASDLHNFNIADENQLRAIIKEISSVLFYLHQSNFIYYDLKPENILVSEINDTTAIKLIDLGFAGSNVNSHSFVARGTAEYIAPEILNNKKHDHRVDLYSLGMLLYRLVYKKFPFSTANELEIYKAHITGSFEFPSCDFSEKIINVIKKLLSKEPANRYNNTLQVLEELDITYDDIRKDWAPVKVFSNRKDVLAVINSFISKQSDGEVFSVRGTEGAGKTIILEEIFERYDKVVFIKAFRHAGNTTFWKALLREIVFSDFVFPSLNNEILASALELFKTEPDDLIGSLKVIIRAIAREKNFILLLDEFNRYDEFSLEIMRQIIPLLQIHNIKLIVSEDSSYPYLAESISNLNAINLTPFTESQLIEYLDKSFASFYPKNEVKKLIMRYADLLPGSIDSFLRDIVLFDLLNFNGTGLSVEVVEDKLKMLTGSQEEIYSMQLKFLNEEELKTARVISLFESSISDDILTSITGYEQAHMDEIINSLREKNILLQTNISFNPEFTSEGLKKHVYTNISDKNSLHITAAEIIEKNYPYFSRTELARQFESAGLYYRSYEKLKDELRSAERLSAFSYKKKILLHLVEFPLTETDINELKYELALTYFTLGDKKSALEIINYLLTTRLKNNRHAGLMVLKGNCLISTGEHISGIKILEDILPEIQQGIKRQEILFDIAAAQFDLNNFNSARANSKKIIDNAGASPETRGKAFNLIGLIEVFENENFENAVNNFENALEVYSKAGLWTNVAGMELNLGNFFNMIGNYEQAENHWNKSMQINQSIGNIEQEAKLLIGYGLNHYDKLEYEKSVDEYKRAISIFSSLGDRTYEGIVLLNLGEVYLAMCDYQNSFEALKRARKILSALKNYEEEAQVLFMLGKFFFILGSPKDLSGVLAEYHKLLEKNLLLEKHKINYELLSQLNLLSEGKYDEITDKLRDISAVYYKYEDKINYVFTVFNLCTAYLETGQYNEALRELKNEIFIDACENSLFARAERNFYLGKLSEILTDSGLNPYLEYYEEAYSLIEEQSITEVTWKILNALANVYYRRGIIGKANEYILYAETIINFVSSSIKDGNMRQAYLLKKERKAVADNFSKIQASENK